MTQAPRDQNRVAARLGSFNGQTIPLAIEHVTGHMKIVVLPETFIAPAISYENAIRDQNNVSSATGSFEDTAKPILVTHADGALRIRGN